MAFFRQAMDNARLYQPMTIVTDKAPTYRRVIRRINRLRSPEKAIVHIDRKWRNNVVESDHAALKRLTDPGKGFQSPRTAKATFKGIEAIRTIKRGQINDPSTGVSGEISFLNGLFATAA